MVVRIWYLRRFIVPVSYFIEKPFQNWTRNTSDLLGTVFIYGDYTLPVDAVRSELHRILQSSKLSDGKVWGLQVTNASDRTMELRALMSAPDPPPGMGPALLCSREAAPVPAGKLSPKAAAHSGRINPNTAVRVVCAR